MSYVKLDRHSSLTDKSSLVLIKGTGGADGAGASFSVGDWVYVNSSENVRWASSAAGVANPTLGIVYKVWENYLVIFTSGEITISGWGLTPSSEYFLGTNGAMTTTAPTLNQTIVQSIGRAISPTKFIINILDYMEN